MRTTWVYPPTLAGPPIEFLKRLASRYDRRNLARVTIGTGRGGNGYSGYCRFPKEGKGYLLSVNVPGPWPADVHFFTKLHDVTDGTRPDLPDAPGVGPWRPGLSSVRTSAGRQVIYQSWERTEALTRDEAIVYIGAHEMFHWLRHSRQIDGKNVEWQAQAWGYARLEEYRKEIGRDH